MNFHYLKKTEIKSGKITFYVPIFFTRMRKLKFVYFSNHRIIFSRSFLNYDNVIFSLFLINLDFGAGMPKSSYLRFHFHEIFIKFIENSIPSF